MRSNGMKKDTHGRVNLTKVTYFRRLLTTHNFGTHY